MYAWFGVLVPKQSANVVAFQHANRPFQLHIPHIGGQSTATIEGLAQISAVLLHPVWAGHVEFDPYGDPWIQYQKWNYPERTD